MNAAPMAYNRIGRDDDHRYPPLETPTDDEDEGPQETSSSVNKQSSSIPNTYFEEVTTIPTELPTWTKNYPSKMSDNPYRPWGSDNPYDGRPSGSGSPPWATNDGSTYRGPPWASTTLSTQTAWGDHNGLQSPTASATPTRVPTDDASSPAPTEDGFPDLQNHGADNGPNRTPMYAAAGVTPVVVIIIGFLVFCCLRKRRRQRQAAAEHRHIEEMKMQPKPVALPYIAPITPPSPPPAVLPQYSPSTPSSSHPPTASSSQPVILGPIPSGNNGAYLTGMDTSDLISMTSANGVSRQGTVVDRDPFADGRSLEEAPPPYRPSSLPPASLASTSRNSSVRMAAPPHMTSRTQLIERSPFDDPEDDEVSELSGPALGRSTDAMSDVSDSSYQVDPVVGRSPF
ncbi:hypothetical protein BU25DRAFT_209970 [Macroventuria anomochaeta]|uniref:Uncharacterized protein n=1 Tax=Macroventuria anomochaeta TaxID=301207 RepID=A0ACB6RKS9_9PLEO|nr:uncharacterized protein BU25DRAFT_209970 [Macroventuria anomochaeta]KAF2622511.1 hypothetical protein BU25DRAFT_209970 [Macroventuria anomochaeta]